MAQDLEIADTPSGSGLSVGQVPALADLVAFSQEARRVGRRLVVGAIVTDGAGRVFLQRRAPTRALFPGAWDIVGGHAEEGEDALAALVREVEEETGWRIADLGPVVKLTDWSAGGVLRREVDLLVTVEGDVMAPAIEAGKHDLWRWIDTADPEMLSEARAESDEWLYSLIDSALAILVETGFGSPNAA